jgi:hypothetical protein
MASKVSARISKLTKENTVGVIAAIIVLLVILLVVAVSFKISSDRRAKNLGQTNEDNSLFTDVDAKRLIDKAGDSTARIYIEKGVTADEKHYSIEMMVNADSRTIKVLKGYQDIEERSQTLPNNLEAYTDFLKALSKFKFDTVRKDDSGYGWREACPLERNYKFSLQNGAEQEFERWYSFCDGKRYGEYGGRVSRVFSLFKNQFPEYSKYTNGISF